MARGLGLKRHDNKDSKSQNGDKTPAPAPAAPINPPPAPPPSNNQLGNNLRHSTTSSLLNKTNTQPLNSVGTASQPTTPTIVQNPATALPIGQQIPAYRLDRYEQWFPNKVFIIKFVIFRYSTFNFMVFVSE